MCCVLFINSKEVIINYVVNGDGNSSLIKSSYRPCSIQVGDTLWD